MPTRRTSPRRTATRPSGLYERTIEPTFGEVDGGAGNGVLAGAAPWLALLAIVLAAAAIAFVLITRSSGGDLTACRTAAWHAIPADKSLPTDWSLGSTDLNANGMTISIVGPPSADGSTDQPVVYASITCYGDAAATALDENRQAATAAGSTVRDRIGASDVAYDVDNPTTGSTTTLFRVGGLVGQIAPAGSPTDADIAKITTAVAAAMGDQTAAGTGGISPTDEGLGSEEPIGSDDLSSAEPTPSFGPELVAMLPTTLGGTALTVDNRAASEFFGPDDPTGRAVAASLRSLGKTLDDLQIAQAFDESQTITDTLVAFRLPGADSAALRAIVLRTWLGAGNAGVKETPVTLAGKSFTKIDYGDAKSNEYVYAKDDFVIVIDTSDVAVATAAAANFK